MFYCRRAWHDINIILYNSVYNVFETRIPGNLCAGEKKFSMDNRCVETTKYLCSMRWCFVSPERVIKTYIVCRRA